MSENQPPNAPERKGRFARGPEYDTEKAAKARERKRLWVERKARRSKLKRITLILREYVVRGLRGDTTMREQQLTVWLTKRPDTEKMALTWSASWRWRHRGKPHPIKEAVRLTREWLNE